jgi:hypothetical protein
MTSPSRRLATLVLVSLLGLAPAALAAVGQVASVEGIVDIGRAGVFSPAETGMDVELGDELRTADGRLRVIFQDDSVLNLAENTRLVIDSQVFEPEQSRFNSVMRLLGGKVRAAVSEYYQQPGAEYEVETPTAVAGVRGTTFLVTYDEMDDVTEVLGIRGRVHVRNLDERLGEGVYVSAKEATTVVPGQDPAPPSVLDELRFRERLDALEILGRQGLGNVASGATLQTGGEVAAADRAPLATSGATTLDDLRDASDVAGQPLGVVETTRGRLGVPF